MEKPNDFSRERRDEIQARISAYANEMAKLYVNDWRTSQSERYWVINALYLQACADQKECDKFIDFEGKDYRTIG